MQFYLKETFYGDDVKVVMLPYDMIKNKRIKNAIRNSANNVSKFRSNLVRAKTNLIARVLHNFWDVDKLTFLTLTFRENLKDIRQANKIFNRFMDYLSKRQKGIMWVVIYEYQKRGAVHFHMLIDEHFDQEEIRRWWDKKHNLGTQFKLKHCTKQNGSHKAVALYLSKYMSKSSNDEKSRNQFDLNVKSYRFSYNAIKLEPVVRVIDLDVRDMPVLMASGSQWNKMFKSKEQKYAIGWVSVFKQLDWVDKVLN